MMDRWKESVEQYRRKGLLIKAALFRRPSIEATSVRRLHAICEIMNSGAGGRVNLLTEHRDIGPEGPGEYRVSTDLYDPPSWDLFTGITSKIDGALRARDKVGLLLANEALEQRFERVPERGETQVA